MLMRCLLLPLLLTLAVPDALAQHPIEAAPNPYDGEVHSALTLRNSAAEPVALDSLRFTSSLNDDPWFGWDLRYVAYLGGEELEGSLICAPTPHSPCWDPFGLYGRALAPGDSIVFEGIYGYCASCRGGGYTEDDTLLVYGGSDPNPLVVEVLNGPFIVSAEGEAAAIEHAVEVYPNPAQGRATLRLDLPTASEIEVRTYDARGRLVVGPERHIVGAGEHPVPLSLAGLSAGVYHVEVRFDAGGGGRSHRAVVVLE
jgi:hypothetical protein